MPNLASAHIELVKATRQYLQAIKELETSTIYIVNDVGLRIVIEVRK